MPRRGSNANGQSSRYPGMKQVSAVVTVEKWRTLRNVATKTERSQTDLIAEAIDDLAMKYAEPGPPKAAGRKRRERSPGQ
jgi:hypothetical protein